MKKRASLTHDLKNFFGKKTDKSAATSDFIQAFPQHKKNYSTTRKKSKKSVPTTVSLSTKRLPLQNTIQGVSKIFSSKFLNTL